MARKQWRGGIFEELDIEGYIAWEEEITRLAKQNPKLYPTLSKGFFFRVLQGSFSNGTLSGNTHRKAGALDASCRTKPEGPRLTWAEIELIIKVVRNNGGNAAWYRGPGKLYGNFSYHLHIISTGTPGLDFSAQVQIDGPQGVLHGKDGFVRRGPDYHRARPNRNYFVNSPLRNRKPAWHWNGLPKAGTVTPSGYNNKSRNHVAVVQECLRLLKNKNGRPYYTGPIDGVRGAVTEGAVANFLKVNGFSNFKGYKLGFHHLDRIIWEAEKLMPGTQMPNRGK